MSDVNYIKVKHLIHFNYVYMESNTWLGIHINYNQGGNLYYIVGSKT